MHTLLSPYTLLFTNREIRLASSFYSMDEYRSTRLNQSLPPKPHSGLSTLLAVALHAKPPNYFLPARMCLHEIGQLYNKERQFFISQFLTPVNNHGDQQFLIFIRTARIRFSLIPQRTGKGQITQRRNHGIIHAGRNILKKRHCWCVQASHSLIDISSGWTNGLYLSPMLDNKVYRAQNWRPLRN